MTPRTTYQTILLLAVAWAVPFAGCLLADDEPAPMLPRVVPPLGSIKGYLAPTGAGALGWLDSYVMTHPFRNALHAEERAAARDDLEALLVGFGLTVERQAYSPSGANILAFRQGSVRPDAWIVLGGHYDVGDTDVYGALDDGSGVSVILELARSGATRAFNHTVVYAFFDEQERGGRLGSRAFVEDAIERAELVVFLNPDPAGLHWPCADAMGPMPIVVAVDPEKVDADVQGYAQLADAVAAALDAARVPQEARLASAEPYATAGILDAESFDQIDVPSAYFGAEPRVGSVAPFPIHSPADTADEMARSCGGRDGLEAGFDVSVDVILGTLTAVDGQKVA